MGASRYCVLVGRFAPREVILSHVAEQLQQGDPSLDGPDGVAIRDVNLAPAARTAGVLVERRLEQRGPEDARRAGRARSARAANGSGIDPRRAHQLERPRRASALRTRSCLRTAPCPG